MNHHNFNPPDRNKQSGVTLIELMVGIAIGLLTIAVAMGAIMVSRGVSGTISDATQIQQQASYAFRVIGQQLRQAASIKLNLAAQKPLGSAIEAADVVLMIDEPSKLVDAIEVAKATKQIVMQNIVIALGIKSVFLILGALGIAGMWEAVFGDVGVTIIAVLNAMRILKK